MSAAALAWLAVWGGALALAMRWVVDRLFETRRARRFIERQRLELLGWQARALESTADAARLRELLDAARVAYRDALLDALNIDVTECDGPPSFDDLLAEVERLVEQREIDQ